MDDRNSHAGDQLGGHRSIFQQLDFRKGSEEPPPTFGPWHRTHPTPRMLVSENSSIILAPRAIDCAVSAAS